MEELLGIIPFLLFFIVFIVCFNVAKKKMKDLTNEEDASKSNSSYVSRYNREREEKVEKPVEHDEHEHQGDVVETYDEIVGSLGSVSDEGCDELIGVRLISNDEAYSQEDGSINYDLNKVVGAMVLGEIIGEPRCKKGFKRKG